MVVCQIVEIEDFRIVYRILVAYELLPELLRVVVNTLHDFHC